MLTIVFFCSIFVIFYAYFGYPICLIFLLLFRRKNIKQQTDIEVHSLPKVSFIITAYNEEKRIDQKIKESLRLEYPEDKFEIIVASDCSNDRTDEIVHGYAEAGVKLVRAPERKGKENAQKIAVQEAVGEILVFSDVATLIEKNGIQNIVKNFEYPNIGCVSSEDKFISSNGEVDGEGAYVKYEMLLRKLESKVNTVVGLSGSFFAARREVCNNWVVDLDSDFNTLLNCVRMGMKGILDPSSVGFYKSVVNEKEELDRKIRTVLRGISVLIRNLNLLNPAIYGLFSWQLFSHKLCRWIVPFLLINTFVSNLFLCHASSFFILTLILQVVFYSMAILYYLTSGNKQHKPFKIGKIPCFFVLVNISILIAWLKYFSGERVAFWEPTKR